MKSKFMVLCAALLMLGVGSANAASTWIGFNGGAGIPTGDYGDAAATGFQFGGTATYMMNSQWGMGADVGYHMWNGSEDANAGAELLFGPGSEFKWSALQATAHVMLNIPTQSSNVSPYLRGGFGIYNIGLKLESPSGDADDSESKVGFNLGAGMNFLSSTSMKWGINGQYHIVPTDLGYDVNFMTVGVNVLWGVGSN
jgi:opacity protein-like surface antigen